jgi:hypothetical protein
MDNPKLINDLIAKNEHKKAHNSSFLRNSKPNRKHNHNPNQNIIQLLYLKSSIFLSYTLKGFLNDFKN